MNRDSKVATMERLSPEFIGRFDARRQREILQEYLARQAWKEAIVTQVQKEFGTTFTEKDQAGFMKGLDLNRNDDLWKWSNVTDIP